MASRYYGESIFDVSDNELEVSDDEYDFYERYEKQDMTRQLLKYCHDGCKAKLGRFKEVLENGADPNNCDESGRTPLLIASEHGKNKLVKLLLRFRAVVDKADVDQQTALHKACYAGHTEVVKILILTKPSMIDKEDKDQQTALHKACYAGHTEVVKILIQTQSTKIDKKDKNHQTALHKACYAGHVKVVKILMQYGSSVIDQKDKWGKTPLDIAKEFGHSDVVSQLEKDLSIRMGPILTNIELQVLSDLLDTYSHEKIKEIQQSIQTKQYISFEEVECSLREGGLTLAADGLKANLHKGVEKAMHYEAYQAALKGAKTVTLRYLRFLFIGPPRSGKSTMRRRLLQQILNLSILGQQSVSTGVSETYEIIIKKLTSEAAAISGSHWYSLKKSSEDGTAEENPCSEIGLDYLAQLFYHLIYQNVSIPSTHNDAASQPDMVASSGGSDNQTLKFNASSTTSREVEAKPAENKYAAVEVVKDVYTSRARISDDKQIQKAFDDLTNILRADSPEKLYQMLKVLTLVNMMDVGGQPEFLDMLPALTIGAALYLLFFRLDQELHQCYPVTFLAPGDVSEMTLETSYCIEEVIHQTLSSIACFGHYSTSTGESVSSRAAFFGTYSDQVTTMKIKEKEKAAKKHFFSSELSNKLLLKTDKGRPFFTVDNMNGTDESEMMHIRSNIEKIVKTYFAEVPIPASWLMFRIVLQLMNKPVVTLAQCEEIAVRLSMPTPVQEALWFFHHNIGCLLHYPEIPSVKHLIFCTPQVIFESITTVIIDNFKHGNYHTTSDVKEQFQQMGLFSLSDISKKTEQQRSTYLSPTQLLDVLKHNYILAEVRCDEEKATSSESKFIIPAVLKQASEEELKPSCSLVHEASPLIICFKGGFVPFGVFSASIAYLIAHANSLSPKWCLHGKEVKKNKVKFLLAGAFIATLISRPQYLEIQIAQHPEAKHEHSLPQVCSTVRQKVIEAIEYTISKMKCKPLDKGIAAELLSSQRPFDLAFKCSLDNPEPHSDHLMKVLEAEKGHRPNHGSAFRLLCCHMHHDDDPSITGKCLNDQYTVDLDRKHLLWFNQVKRPQSEATGNRVSSASPAPQPMVMLLSGATDNPNTSPLDGKPTLAKLMVLKLANGEKIKIIDSLAPNWNRFGILLEFDDEGTQVETIHRKHHGDPLECCQAIFHHWLNGNGRTPLSWRTLIELLEDLDEKVIAGKVCDAFT